MRSLIRPTLFLTARLGLLLSVAAWAASPWYDIVFRGHGLSAKVIVDRCGFTFSRKWDHATPGFTPEEKLDSDSGWVETLPAGSVFYRDPASFSYQWVRLNPGLNRRRTPGGVNIRHSAIVTAWCLFNIILVFADRTKAGRPSVKWRRYSTAVLLCILAIGVIAQNGLPTREEKLVSELRQLSAAVYYYRGQPNYVHVDGNMYKSQQGELPEAWVNDCLAKAVKLPSLDGVKITDAQITARGLSLLKRAKQLKVLMVAAPRRSTMTDKCLEHIVKLTSLESLWLYGFEISDHDLAKLLTLTKLRGLTIEESTITNSGLLSLRKLPELRRVDIYCHGGISYEAIRDLRQQLPDCDILVDPWPPRRLFW